MTYFTTIQTPAGELLLLSDGQCLTGMYWTVFERAPAIQPDWQEREDLFADAKQQLAEYFAGERKAFDLECSPSGTDFQRAVWQQLMNLPFGITTTYKSIAEAIGKPKAVRAVGTAVGSNPFMIIIPCHRVLPADGRVGGYAGGPASKRSLLALENISYRD